MSLIHAAIRRRDVPDYSSKNKKYIEEWEEKGYAYNFFHAVCNTVIMTRHQLDGSDAVCVTMSYTPGSSPQYYLSCSVSEGETPGAIEIFDKQDLDMINCQQCLDNKNFGLHILNIIDLD